MINGMEHKAHDHLKYNRIVTDCTTGIGAKERVEGLGVRVMRTVQFVE
jgi:hypothetical protein